LSRPFGPQSGPLRVCARDNTTGVDRVIPFGRSMKVYLVHIRDPQFYAIPGNVRGENGRLQVMGFPPIGIMSLSSVLKRAGHEVRLFDQANPETPDAFIVAEMQREKPDLVGLSFLSTTSS